MSIFRPALPMQSACNQKDYENVDRSHDIVCTILRSCESSSTLEQTTIPEGESTAMVPSLRCLLRVVKMKYLAFANGFMKR